MIPQCSIPYAVQVDTYSGTGFAEETYCCPGNDICVPEQSNTAPNSKVHGTNMGPIWDQQGPGGPHVGPINLDIWGSPL